MLFGLHSQHRWGLLVCDAGGDAGCDAGLVGAPGAPLRHVGASYWCRCKWVCAVLGGCQRSFAGCCVLCFLFCACVPLLTACMLCSSYLYSCFSCATPHAYSAFCLVIHCTARCKQITICHVPTALYMFCIPPQLCVCLQPRTKMYSVARLLLQILPASVRDCK